MIYHRYSMVGYMLWARYALLRGQPFRSLTDVYAQHLESPGTQAFTVSEARRMFADFARVEITRQLSFGDLLQGAVGQRHRGAWLTLAKRVWPRWLIRTAFRSHALQLLIQATK